MTDEQQQPTSRRSTATQRQRPYDEQQSSQQPLSRGEDVASSDELSEVAPALAADRIIEILRGQPELTSKIKRVVAIYLQNQGQTVQESELTDERLFDEIDRNPDLQVMLTKELKDRGYLSQADLDDLQKQTLEAQGGEPEGGARTGAQMAPRPGEEQIPQLSRRPSARAPRGRARVQREIQPIPDDQNRPEVTRRPSPYPNLPSLRDLYAQIPTQEKDLKRFGADLFRNTSSLRDKIPIDLPAGPDYVLGPGDGLEINVWGGVAQRLTRTIDREGRILLPETGNVVMAGKTLGEAKQLIQQALSTQFKAVNVDVSLTRLRTVRVYVVGDVQRPGAYDISSLSTPLNALYAAGGPTQRGSLRTVRQFRGSRVIEDVDLYDFMLHGTRPDGHRLESGDTIQVPPVGPQVTVAGVVRRPAIYELRNERDLSQVLDLAGGVLVSATLRQIRVERIEAHEQRTMLSLSLPDSNDREAIQKALREFQVQDGDRVTIAPILPYSNKTVYLQGHVFRPGKYPYRKGMTITDLIHSYDELLPEPASRAELIRLLPPDFHPEMLEFNLDDVLSGDDPVELQPFDTVRVLGRYEVDAPRVSIYGEVLNPGEYPLSKDMTAAGLVKQAGGFKRSALKQSADIATYVVQNGQKILTQHHTIEIGKAVAGDKTADTELQPNDVVTIHQLAGWKDIGAAVTLNGEVMYPGTYGIQEGEKLSNLIRRAGGFRVTAYPEGAVLERTQVRELAEKTRADLVRRIQATALSTNVSSSSGQEQAALMQAMTQQQQQVLAALQSQPATGRLVVTISSDLKRWENSPADIQLRAGDVLTIPKRPNFVLVNGQVYNPSAITFQPGNSAGWYLKQAGGPTELANRKAIFVVRANGSVISGREGWWSSGVLSARMQPGDTIVVPDKIVGGTSFWKNMMTTAQITSSLAIAARVATSF